MIEERIDFDPLEKLGVLWLLKVLQISEIGNEFVLFEILLLSKPIEIKRISEHLHELLGSIGVSMYAD